MLQALVYSPEPKRMSEATSEDYKQQIEHAARYLQATMCCIKSKDDLERSLIKSRIFTTINNNNKHRHAVDRAKRRLSLHASLPLLVNIALPGALSAITNTDTQVMSAYCEQGKGKKDTGRVIF